VSVHYRGTVDEQAVSGHARAIGELIEAAGDLGFVLTYHASKDGGGRMGLSGTGISQEVLGLLFAEALDHNAEHGCTL